MNMSLSWLGGASSDSLVNGVVKMLVGGGSPSNGLAALVQSFQQKGLGDLVSSWIGTGENRPISAEQINQGLGQEQLKQLAETTGLSTEATSSKLAEILPGIVDKLTPDGKIPESGLLEQGSNLFKGLL
jgi:uncharacterized protein YidB (DUF937 family)